MNEQLGSLKFAQVNRSLRVAPLLWSILVHFVAAGLLTLLVVLERSKPAVVSPAKGAQAQVVRAEAVVLPAMQKPTRLQIPQTNARRAPRKMQAAGRETGDGVAAVRAQARRETAAIVQNFKFRTTYGFSPYPRYELPFQTSGQIPVVSVDELPPRFEQYLIVEVTIDSQGRRFVNSSTGPLPGKVFRYLHSATWSFIFRRNLPSKGSVQEDSATAASTSQ